MKLVQLPDVSNLLAHATVANHVFQILSTNISFTYLSTSQSISL